MKALFNSSCIKGVFLRNDTNSYIELEITYVNDSETRWISRKSVTDMSDFKYHNDKYTKQYERIKEALSKNQTFVEIEL